MADRRVVYSSSGGDQRKAPPADAVRARAAQGGRVKVKREVAGRRGKGVTTVYDLPLRDPELKALAGKLKKQPGGTSYRPGLAHAIRCGLKPASACTATTSTNLRRRLRPA